MVAEGGAFEKTNLNARPHQNEQLLRQAFYAISLCGMFLHGNQKRLLPIWAKELTKVLILLQELRSDLGNIATP